MLQITLRFTKEVWTEMFRIIDTDPATKVFINFEEGVMSTTFLFFNDMDENSWEGYITGLRAINKTAPYDEGNMFAFELQDIHLYDIREYLDEDFEPVLHYQPRRLYTRQYRAEKLTIDAKAKNKYRHYGNGFGKEMK